MRLANRALVLAMALGAATAQAQEPSGPPPPSTGKERSGPDLRELLPDIGRIGAEVGVLAGVSGNPYETGPGGIVGGFIDLPLFRLGAGKVSYEIAMAVTLAKGDPFAATELVRGFPVTRSVSTRLRAVDVSPFSLKYALRGGRFRPYLTLGADVLIATTRDDPPSESSEREDRGTPRGAATIELGGHAGAGFEIRVTSGLSWNAEYRFARFEGRNARLHAAVTGFGIHW
jgi:opacity protein-like surface antigen